MKKAQLLKAIVSLNGNLSPDVINSLSPDVIKNLSPYVINSLSPDVIKNLSPYVINSLSPDVIKNLSPDVINSLSPDVINSLSPDVIKNLSPYVIKNLSPDVINSLSPYVINSLSPYVINSLSPDVIKNLSPYVINSLSPDVIKNLSPYVIKNLSILQALPLIENQYSRMLEDINDKKIVYKQSTFGELNDFDAKLNVCESPMCIAGHQVHMAGADGYKAKKQFGYPTTAAFVHLKAYPDAPVFNYLLTDNSAGMAYIEMMAEFEQRENKEQKFPEWMTDQLNATKQ